MPSRSFIADTFALLVFFTVCGVVTERFVGGMEWDEVARSRLVGAPLMVLTARPYGLWRDAVLRALPGPLIVRDTLALLVFQVPIYATIVWSSGADGGEIARATGSATLGMLVLGRPYGLWLDWVRERFGLPPGGMAPMSPGG